METLDLLVRELISDFSLNYFLVSLLFLISFFFSFSKICRSSNPRDGLLGVFVFSAILNIVFIIMFFLTDMDDYHAVTRWILFVLHYILVAFVMKYISVVIDRRL